MIDPIIANFITGLAICGATVAVVYSLKALAQRLSR